MTLSKSLKTAAVVAAMMVTAVAWAAQQPAPQTPGTAQPVAQAMVTGCAQAHPMAERTIDMTDRRLEAARQANSPAAMRAAIDDMQAALRQLRMEIAPCAGLQSVAVDPHAGPVMPGTAQAAPPAAVPVAPMDHAKMPMAGSAPAANQAAAVGAKPAPAAPMDHSKMPMGGNAAPGTPGPATARKPAPVPRAATPAPAAADAHAGHAMPIQPDVPAAQLIEDPVSKTKVDPKSSLRVLHQGKMYYFRSDKERQEFIRNPEKYVSRK